VSQAADAEEDPPCAWINDITDWTDLSTNKVLQMVWDRRCWRDVVHRAAKVCNDEWGINNNNKPKTVTLVH